jgi:hypothetical protein
MRFNCWPTAAQRTTVLQDWHLWFAWYPARVAPREMVWLETVRRKGLQHYGPGGGYWVWEYSEVDA